jgi:hypothetical protein
LRRVLILKAQALSRAQLFLISKVCPLRFSLQLVCSVLFLFSPTCIAVCTFLLSRLACRSAGVAAQSPCPSAPPDSQPVLAIQFKLTQSPSGYAAKILNQLNTNASNFLQTYLLTSLR